MTWLKSGVAVEALPEVTPQEVVLGSQTLVLVRLGGTVHALDGTCPHLGGLLAEGRVEEARLVCPLHGATFAIDTGAVMADPFGVTPPEGAVEPLRRYPTKIEGGMVEVGVPGPDRA